MRMYFKQRFFSLLDRYDIYDEQSNILYTVKSKLDWGHILKVYDRNSLHVATLREKAVAYLPGFDIYIGGEYIGCIKKEFTIFKPIFDFNYNGWSMTGDWLEWEYSIVDKKGDHIAFVSKKLFKITDQYVIDVYNPDNAQDMLMAVLAIDVQKCSKGK